MKKATVACIVLLALLLCSCGNIGVSTTLMPETHTPESSDVTAASEVNNNSDNSETEQETPTERSRIESTDLKPSEIEDAKVVAYVFMGKMQQLENWSFVETGSTKAKKGIISYTQNISAETYRSGEEYYNTSLSDSLIVHSSHRAYFKGDKVICGDEKEEMSLAEYKETYGVSPLDVALCGYILNDKTLEKAEKIGEEEGILSYRFTLSGNAGAEYVRRQMQAMGDLDGLPEMMNVTLVLKINDDWTPAFAEVYAEYNISIPVLGKLSCTQELFLTYTVGKNEKAEEIFEEYR